MQDAMEATARRLGRAAAVMLTTLVALGATASGASATSACVPPGAGPQVCVKNAGSSTSVPPSTATLGGLKFVSYDVSVTNNGPSTVTHVTLADALTALGTLVSGTTTDGTCTSSAGSAACAFGSVPRGATVTATILVQAPDIQGLVVNAATASFDEAFNDSPAADPKQDTVTASTTTPVNFDEAVSVVPPNTEVRLDTDPTGAPAATIGKARVPASNHPVIAAALNLDPSPFTCPKKQICRAGAWVHADIGNGLAFTPALEFELHWSKVLVPKQQTVKNLVVLHAACPVGCVPTMVSRRCSPSDPVVTECLSDVVETATEFRATLHSKTNGYMR